MNEQMINKLENELRRAYAFLCYDDDTVEEKAHDDAMALVAMAASLNPETIETDSGTLIGYPINVFVSTNDSQKELVVCDNVELHREKMRVLKLVMTKDDLCYVDHSYDAYTPTTWEFGDPVDIKNSNCKVVKLESVDFENF